MKARHASQIRFAILSAREDAEPARLTPGQQAFLWRYGHPKAWVLDGRLEHEAYCKEVRAATRREAAA